MNNTYTEAKQITDAFPDEPWPEGPLKEVLVEYVGKSNDSEQVTVEMIVQTMADEFPEFLMLIAEENFIRGYQQAIHDVDEGRKLLEEHNEAELEPSEENV